MHRTKSGETRFSAEQSSQEPGRPSALAVTRESSIHYDHLHKDDSVSHKSPEVPCVDTDETSSLMSKLSLENPGDGAELVTAPDSHRLDVRGLALLPRVEFWQLFAMLGLLTGIGLMTIK